MIIFRSETNPTEADSLPPKVKVCVKFLRISFFLMYNVLGVLATRFSDSIRIPPFSKYGSRSHLFPKYRSRSDQMTAGYGSGFKGSPSLKNNAVFYGK